MVMSFRIGRATLLLLVFIPFSLYLGFFTQYKTLALITTVCAIIPLSRIIGYATNELALQTSPTVGGLLSATFGNVVELIIAVFALRMGLIGIVQASIVGSILGNLLLLIGLSIFFGGLRFKEQKFNKDSVGVSSTMLIIAIVGLAVPTVYSMVGGAEPGDERIINDAVAAVLALIYVAGLIFAFVTHKHLFDASDEVKAKGVKHTISIRTASIILLLATVAVVFESELLVEGFKHATVNLGLTQTFLG
ncbi:MAG: cation transporter, partial [Candidatus Altiarchaeota archaeon]